MVMRMEAGKLRENRPAKNTSACTPPAEVPIARMSRFAIRAFRPGNPAKERPKRQTSSAAVAFVGRVSGPPRRAWHPLFISGGPRNPADMVEDGGLRRAAERRAERVDSRA